MKKRMLIALIMCLLSHIINAQSVETYAGYRRVGVDLLWFKSFKNAKDARTPFLFFSRSRASTDYKNAPTAFGSTNAVSYNFKNGWGIVAVASFLNAGFTPKAGVQYVKTQGDFVFFGWLVADLKAKGSVDAFGLFRYQPKIGENWRFFGQFELFPVYNPAFETWNLTQRLRLGARYAAWAAGFMADFNQSGHTVFTKTNNIGGFLRYEF